MSSLNANKNGILSVALTLLLYVVGECYRLPDNKLVPYYSRIKVHVYLNHDDCQMYFSFKLNCTVS